uniref:ATP synthase subunit delta, chloroplastic n=1 Tax=Caloglossa intermedia TaxID=100879 RepID=A0A1Z1M6R3_9FLOR|nr:ATP synthase CF1 subunit delta [Caloglossa intermedia]ARW61444.1 ATP synthase CF1 subunit delta [Caloglossa intermedia]
MNSKNLVEKISIPYAEALLELAQKNQLLKKINEDLSFILNSLSESKDLQLCLVNPLLGATVKKNIFNTLFKEKISNKVLNFLFVLIDKRRINILQPIIDKYFELVNKLESITIVELIASTELTETQQSALVDKIKSITDMKNIKLVISVDVSLIAGFILKIGSKVIDTSVTGKLRQISLYLNAS